LPGKHTTLFPLRRYGFIAGAATLLIVLVSWVAVRAVGPTQSDARVPLMVQPTVPLAAGAGPSLTASVRASTTPSASKRPSPTATTGPAPTRTKPKPTSKPAVRKTSRAPAAAFTGSYTAARSWERGFIAAVTVTNKSGPARGWTVKVTFAARDGVRVGNVWNARVDRQGDTFVFTGGPLAPGASATLGFEASKQVRDRIQPSACTVDGASCRLN
jgi:cytoskeletal protein RodZ